MNITLEVKKLLEKADHALEVAEELKRKNYHSDAASKVYYAMFYAVSSLLLSKNLSSSKHSGIRSLFNKEFVNKGLLDKEPGKFYSKIFEERQEGDYKDFIKFDKNIVGEWTGSAENFIQKIENVTLNIINK